jgi:hypothetical protein
MEVSELRVGNFVALEGNIIIVDYNNIRIQTFADSNFINSEGLTYKSYDAIPLTKELLIKLGFNLVDEINMGFTITINRELKLKLYISLSGIIALVDELLQYKDIIFPNKIEGLHQLQNIYKDFSGKELKFNLKENGKQPTSNT